MSIRSKPETASLVGVPGTYAQLAVAPANRLVPIPEGVNFQQAAAALTQGLTAHYLTHSTYPIQSGDEVLIHAGAGGTGLLFIQMAKARGARVSPPSPPKKKPLLRALPVPTRSSSTPKKTSPQR